MRVDKKLLLPGIAASLALTVAACGGDSGGGSEGGSGGSGGSGEGSPLEGVSIAIGSKDFTENILLGEMLAQALEANGATVDNRVNLGGTVVNREALLAGDIGVYPEYNGTGWVVHLGNEDPSQDPDELYTMTSEADLEQNDIKWVGRSPFNDTYGFAANGDLSQSDGPFDLQGMADYLEANPDATVCMETEFPNRDDGLVLFEDATGYEVPQSQIEILETGLIYTQTSEGACDFGEVFTTDGRIQALNLELVEDPGVFILYNVSYTMANEIYQANAETYDQVAETILQPLDEERMAALNAQVDVEGTPAATVAEDYLTEIGVLD